MANGRRYVSLGKQIFIFFWLAMFIYITSHVVLNTGEVNLATERQLQRTLKKLETLHAQNKELSSVVDMLRGVYLKSSQENKAVLDDRDRNKLLLKHSELENNERREPKGTTHITQNEPQSHTASGELGPRLEQELARRKVDTDATEFWFYMRSELQKLRTKAGNGSSLYEEIETLLETGKDYQKTMRNDFHSLSDKMAGSEAWRYRQSQSLGNLVQRRLKFLQNPKNCNTTKKLICTTSKACGYGCQLHHLTYCLIVAYSTERTMILQSKGWKYAPKGWETIFLPMSETCTDANGTSTDTWRPYETIRDTQVIQMPIIDGMPARPAALPLAVPADLADHITRFHGNPAAWWIGQIVTYLTRPTQDLEFHFTQTKSKLNFSHPIVGVQVRRTDKITAREAGFHSVDEYMTYVEEWFDTYEQKHPGTERKVYLATDDTHVLVEAQSKFPNYTFLNDQSISKSAGLSSRYSESSVRGVVTDIHILSLCDFLVCTFSSQVCRAAYELMQPMRGDASGLFKSLDDIYYYGGQHPHEYVVVEPHKKRQPYEINLRVGDIVHMYGNHWDGYSKGANTRTGQTGLFPSYKIRDKVVKVKMPTYPQVTPDR